MCDGKLDSVFPNTPLLENIMKKLRDDFSENVKRALALRVSHICSNPNCRTFTIAPQQTSTSTVSIGVAAHITAAAEGGPRYDATFTSVQRTSIDNGIWLCQNCAKLIDSDILRFPATLLHKWKLDAEAEASRRLGCSSISTENIVLRHEVEIKRNLELRDQMQAEFLKSPIVRQQLHPIRHPYEKFVHTEAIIRAIDDRDYPHINPSRVPSNWFKVEIYDFYHNGLKVIVWPCKGIINKDGYWATIKDDLVYDEQEYKEITILQLGNIPWRNIRHYDISGDEYYRMPHIYCSYSEIGPYENFSYVLFGDAYDYPLEESRKLF